MKIIWIVGRLNPCPNKPRFLRVFSTSLLKTLCENKKLLVTSNLSFSHSVFYPYREVSKGLFSKVINTFPNKPCFLRVCSISLLKTPWEKEKLLVTSNFSFSHSVFYPSRELSAIFTKIVIVICRLFQFRRVMNLSFGKGLKVGTVW